jgi:hypothetical protein
MYTLEKEDMHDDGGINVVVNSPRDIFKDLRSKKNEMWKVTETSVAMFVFCGPCNLRTQGFGDTRITNGLLGINKNRWQILEIGYSKLAAAFTSQ